MSESEGEGEGGNFHSSYSKRKYKRPSLLESVYSQHRDGVQNRANKPEKRE